MMIHLSVEIWGENVPIQIKFKQSVNSSCTYFFTVMVFFLSLILVLININLTGNNDPEIEIHLFSICQVIQVF